MKVKAKYNFAFLGVKRLGGDIFTVSEEEYAQIAGDVEVLKTPKTVAKKVAKKVSNKQIKKSKKK